MVQTHARKAPHLNRVLVSALALAALGGWGMFIHTNQTSSEVEAQLRSQVASLQDTHQQIQSQREQAEAASSAEALRLRQDLSSASDAFTRLSEQHNRTKAELAEAQAKLQPAPQAQSARKSASPVAFIDVKPRPAPQDVVAAQKALTELGYGPLKADGDLGPGTRQAIEKYQRDAGLRVTGELHAETLQILLDPAKRLASQD
ncbi:peptidoglycan-binding domain-containing protein [Microvirga subterranea]|uniref:Putative peptidoglycan binding protein n=1 Tax=Microvirga subterranea TaxID=186651 RepID=A0A370HI73_9HYPH|nr:peptidoglycan-binding domain-containing protein [Microvirga subterranea]RDI57814.1 putative peptidoglycan binding protein [Microvirga subterranea]